MNSVRAVDIAPRYGTFCVACAATASARIAAFTAPFIPSLTSSLISRRYHERHRLIAGIGRTTHRGDSSRGSSSHRRALVTETQPQQTSEIVGEINKDVLVDGRLGQVQKHTCTFGLCRILRELAAGNGPLNSLFPPNRQAVDHNDFTASLLLSGSRDLSD